MLRINRLLTILLLAALILSACQPIQPVAPGQETAPAPSTQGPLPLPQQPRSDAPAYGVRGPYAVGVRDFVIEPTKEYTRPLTVSVWYPALNPAGREESIIYTMKFPTTEMPPFITAGRALAGAAPDAASGPYPLVVFSHGQWLYRQQLAYFVEHLASHGFVVIATDHEDNWGTILTPYYTSEISRPQDIKRQLDFAETLTISGGALEKLVDLEYVAVAGNSFGGEIALEMGGGRLNLASFFAEWCKLHPGTPDDPFNDCVGYPPYVEEMAALAGLDAVPKALWPDWSDPRVDAIVAMAPPVQYLGTAGLQSVHLPILLIRGSLDSLTGAANEYYQSFVTISSVNKTQVLFENADHFIINNACVASPGLADAGFYFVCSDSVWDMDRAHDLINHFATAFLLAELKGDAEAAKALAPANVTFPGIQYETTAYGE